VKSLSLSDLITSGVPCWVITVLIKAYAISLAMLDSFHGWKYAYLVNSSPITNIKSYSVPIKGSLDFGSLTMKSSAIVDYASSGKLVVYSKPYGLCLIYLALWHVLYSLMYSSTSFLIRGHV
jgi:hypothetical protein